MNRPATLSINDVEFARETNPRCRDGGVWDGRVGWSYALRAQTHAEHDSEGDKQILNISFHAVGYCSTRRKNLCGTPSAELVTVIIVAVACHARQVLPTGAKRVQVLHGVGLAQVRTEWIPENCVPDCVAQRKWARDESKSRLGWKSERCSARRPPVGRGCCPIETAHCY